MLKEALEYMARVGRESAPTVVRVDAEPAHVYFLREPGGELVKMTADPKPAAHAAFSLQAIVAKAVQHAPHAEVWFSPGAVVVDFGQGLRNYATLDLTQSDPFATLVKWRQHQPALSQAELIRQLRVTFRDSLARAGELVEVLRKVRFNASQTTEGEVGHGKASLGKAITGEVTGTKAIPEYVTFDLPVYSNPCFRSVRGTVECALEPDAATGTFRVIPLPGQLEAALDAALAAVGSMIVEQLGDAEVPVYYGKP